MEGKMKGVTLPGGDRVEFREYDIPKPGYGQVLLDDLRQRYQVHIP